MPVGDWQILILRCKITPESFDNPELLVGRKQSKFTDAHKTQVGKVRRIGKFIDS